MHSRPQVSPRAPTRQMVVRFILCPCLEGAKSREPAKPSTVRGGNPRPPSLCSMVFHMVCRLFSPLNKLKCTNVFLPLPISKKLWLCAHGRPTHAPHAYAGCIEVRFGCRPPRR